VVEGGTEKSGRGRAYGWASWGAAVLRPYMVVLKFGIGGDGRDLKEIDG
jgi:hypothetical protein